jgi:hypothetical protein
MLENLILAVERYGVLMLDIFIDESGPSVEGEVST